ncbi:hypothetical protein CFN78_22240 [Amycolatopsis antarctica]|uniref:PPE family domain-containing protein n=2 Tax=Amycolatopsis antarctica TaxID=1854586 RepID=A0A263D060_9PSEU|nr:hypothetical protein [Amycolatopsis antarctica]OZM71017.1 hypothetical protein CFN78_22240 [Amycolatopsis antarctica]
MYGSDSGSNGSAGSSVYGGQVALGDGSASSDIVAQARSRQDGFDYGADLAIASPPNWEAQESSQLYIGATSNNEPASAEGLSQTWSHHGRELHQAANDLYTAISELGAAWIGGGAAAAQGSLVAIANSSSQAGEAANVMSNRMTQQAAAAAEVKKMPAPKEFDPAQQTAAMLAGGPAAMTADLKVQADAAKDVKAQQVQYFNAYTSAMSEVDGTTPSFAPASLGLKPAANVSGLNAASMDVGGMPGGPAGIGGVQPGSLTVAGAGAGGLAPGLGQAGSETPAHTSTSGYAAQSGPSAGSVTGGGSMPSAPQAPAAPATTAQALGGAAVGGALGFAGGRALGAGNRSGTKQQSSDSGSAAQGQGNSAAAASPQQPGVVPAGGTIGAGAPPPAGPVGGGAGMGAARQQQEQEEEHTHASFLIEADPDEAFGANEATPPPVIGAWSEDEER